MSRTGATPSVDFERLEQRPADEEVGPEDVVRGRVLGLAARLQQPDLEHLARVVPLVDGRVDVQPLVALEPDQLRAERRREDLGELGLADPGLALEQQRAAQLQREEDGRRERSVGDVVPRSGSRPGWPRWNASPRDGWHGRSSAESTRPARRPGSAPPAAECLARTAGIRARDAGRRAVGYGGQHGWHLGEGDLIGQATRPGGRRSRSYERRMCRSRKCPGSASDARRAATWRWSRSAIGPRSRPGSSCPSDDAGAYVWKTVDLADVKGSLIPRDDPQVEAVCADGAGRILILQESPPRVELLDWAARTVGHPDRPRDPRRTSAPRLVGRRRELAG